MQDPEQAEIKRLNREKADGAFKGTQLSIVVTLLAIPASAKTSHWVPGDADLALFYLLLGVAVIVCVELPHVLWDPQRVVFHDNVLRANREVLKFFAGAVVVSWIVLYLYGEALVRPMLFSSWFVFGVLYWLKHLTDWAMARE